MKTTVSMTEIKARAAKYNIPAGDIARQVTMLAYDIATDRWPENDVTLINGVKNIVAGDLYEFAIH